jgi:hypothetical protein
MWAELAFRDVQSTRWQWQRSHVWDPEPANRLWSAMALAYAWVLSVGTQALGTPAWGRELTRRRRRRHRVLALGLCLLQRWLTLGRQLGYELLPISRLPSDPKTVAYEAFREGGRGDNVGKR